MRKLLIFILVGFGAGLFWYLREPETSDLHAIPELGTEPDVVSVTSNVRPRFQRPVTHPESEIGRDYVTSGQLDILAEWRTPMDFYGKVVDEGGRPIPDASVSLSWNDDTGTKLMDLMTDAEGLFSLTDKRGKALSIHVQKAGYLKFAENQTLFFYAGERDNFVPDPTNPKIFRLRKVGFAEPLLTCQATFKVARDGRPLFVNLESCRQNISVGESDISVECWTGPKDPRGGRGGRYSWKFRLSVREGGVQETNLEFPFQAPDDGYRREYVFNMEASDPKWNSRFKKKFFLRLAGGRYARTSIEMVAGGDHFVEINSFLNPSGSRNLEYDPAVQPKPASVFE